MSTTPSPTPTSNNNSNNRSHSSSRAQAMTSASRTTTITPFEEQRQELVGEIADALEQVLQNLNRLNRNLEGVIAVGNEFSSVEALWSQFEGVMGRDGEAGDGREGGEGDVAGDGEGEREG